MQFLILTLLALALMSAPSAASPDWADATPTAWHQLARAESLLFAPEPPNPVAVCVVDSGVNITPDLEGVVIERLAYDGGDPGDTYPQDGIDDGHGTYVATFLAGQVNGWGGAGLWPRAKIVSVRVFPPGAKRARAADYIRGLRICAQRPNVRVINLSLGDVDASARELAEMRDRISDYRLRLDINVVAAAGNRGGLVEAPASFPAALAVGAKDGADAFCTFSARGRELDLSAPGCDLLGADASGSKAAFAGTSFAAPMVSAALAALRAYRGLNADQAERLLLEAADRSTTAGPLLDVEAAMAPVSFGRRPNNPEPLDHRDSPTSNRPAGSGFIEYPRPQVELRRRRRGRLARIHVSNRPEHAQVDVRIGRNIHTKRTSAFRVVWDGRKLLSVRFISNQGASPWTRLRSARRGMRVGSWR